MSARILVTGSRHWTDDVAIKEALARFIAYFEGPVTIVCGGVYGADRTAAILAPAFGPHITVERWPADWYGPCLAECRPNHRKSLRGITHCPDAGNHRNADMIAAGADLCLAFPMGESRNSRDCMLRAWAAGIRVVDLGIGVAT